MTNEEFQRILDAQLDRVRGVLGAKGNEYASDTDRLHNFKVSAMLQGISVPEALRGKMAKHTVSIYDMINSGKPFTVAEWDEKITDHINYLILLRAAIFENVCPPELEPKSLAEKA